MSVPVSFDPLRLERRRLEVVGVVEHSRNHSLREQTYGQIYVPFLHFPEDDMTIAVRASGDTQALARAIDAEVQGLDRSLPIQQVRAMRDYVSRVLAGPRFSTHLISIFGIGSLFLAAIGIYGVVSFLVGQRQQEFGVRMALGAEPHHILWMVLRQGLVLVLVGVALGVPAALALSRAGRSLLFNVGPSDPATYVTIALVLGAVGIAACWLPARRAARTPPLLALRCE